jgi:hypothetical protein
LYCPLLEKDFIPDLPCEQCKRFCDAKAATLPRLGAVARSLILEAMNPPDKTPLRTLSEQASRRRAMDQLSKAGLLLAWYRWDGGSWETKDGNKYYRPGVSRLKRVPKLTPLGEAMAELIADDIDQGRRIRWSKVLQKLPPIGKNMIQVKKAWIETLRQKLKNYQEKLSLLRTINPTAPGIPEISKEIAQTSKHIREVEALTFLEHHPGQLTVWDDGVALFRYTHIPTDQAS